MADLVVITPTRGRPERFRELVEAVTATTRNRVQVAGLVDLDDPAAATYREASSHAGDILIGPRRSLSGWTNFAAELLLTYRRVPYLASLGDDHRPRTPDWDLKLIEAIEQLDGPGFAYGNDLLQGELLPTAWVASAEVVEALGWMMLPGCEHLYVDTAVLELGRQAGRIAYRPDVVIEHLHPGAGKADWDDSYRASNAPERFRADEAAYQMWRRGQLAADAEIVRSLHHRATTTA